MALSLLGFGSSADVTIELANTENRKRVEVKGDKTKVRANMNGRGDRVVE